MRSCVRFSVVWHKVIIWRGNVSFSWGRR